VHAVLLREALHQPLLVLPHPAGDIVGYPNLQGPIRLASKNVDIILAVHGSVILVDSRLQGNDLLRGARIQRAVIPAQAGIHSGHFRDVADLLSVFHLP